MGASITGYVVYGIIASAGLTKGTTRKRGCKHKITDAMKFCPECGAPAYIESSYVEVDYYPDEGLGFFPRVSDEDNGVFGFCLADCNPEYDDIQEVSDIDPSYAEELIKFFADRKIVINESDVTTHLVVVYE